MKASQEFGNLENLFEIADMLLADPMLLDMEPLETSNNNTVELTKVGVEVYERAVMQLEVIKDEPEDDIFDRADTIFGDKARNLSSFAMKAQTNGIINGGPIGSEQKEAKSPVPEGNERSSMIYPDRSVVKETLDKSLTHK